MDNEGELPFCCPKCERRFELEIARDSHEEFCDVLKMAKQLPGWPLAEGFPSIAALQECADEKFRGGPSHIFTGFTAEEISTVQAALPKDSFIGVDAAKHVLFFKFSPAVTKAAEHVRYHGTSFETLVDAVADPFPYRLAVGHSVTGGKPGIYFSATLSGAFQYCFGGPADLAVLLTLKAPWGRKVGPSDRNKVSNRPTDCFVVGACVFKCKRPFNNGLPEQGKQHPIKSLDMQKCGFDEAYVSYCMTRCKCGGCNSDGTHQQHVAPVKQTVTESSQPSPRVKLTHGPGWLKVGAAIPPPSSLQDVIPGDRPLAEIWEDDGFGAAEEQKDETVDLAFVPNFDCLTPRLRAIVQALTGRPFLNDINIDRVLTVLNKLEFLGIRSSNLWDEPNEILQEIATLPLNISTVEREVIREIYVKAEQSCQRLVRQRADAADIASATVSQRVQTTGVPVIAVSNLSLASSSNPYFKQLPPPTVGDIAVQQVEVDPKMPKLLDSMWTIAQDAGNTCRVFAEYTSVPESHRNRVKNMYFAEWSRQGPGPLRSHLAAFRRVHTFMQELALVLFTAPPYAFRLYLHEQRSKGVSVPKQQLGELRALQQCFGFSWELDELDAATISSFTAALKQADVIPLKLWIQFEDFAMNATNKFVQLLSAIWILLAIGGVRFAHLQRSRVFQIKPAYVVFFCALGKSKQQGQRRPYYWAVPRQALRARFIQVILDIIATVPMVRQEGEESTFWLLPDFGPTGSLDTLSTFKNVPMSISRFHQFSRDLIMRMDFADRKELAVTTSTYSARRLLPTLADIVRCPPDDRIVLGHWAGNKSLQDTARALAMPSRYSDSRSYTEAKIRRSMVETVKDACTKASKAVCLSESWEDLLRKSSYQSGCAKADNFFDAAVQVSADTLQQKLLSEKVALPGGSSSDSSDTTSSSSSESETKPKPSTVIAGTNSESRVHVARRCLIEKCSEFAATCLNSEIHLIPAKLTPQSPIKAQQTVCSQRLPADWSIIKNMQFACDKRSWCQLCFNTLHPDAQVAVMTLQEEFRCL